MSTATLLSLPTALPDAVRLGARLGLSVGEIAVHHFPDGELRVSVLAPSPLTIVYGSLDHPNDKLLTLLFAGEALRRNGAERLVLVAPYLCYMRQDTAFHAGEAVSQKVVGRLLAGTFDRVITVNAHLHRTVTLADVFSSDKGENLSAMPAVAAALRAEGCDPATIVVGPDAESRSAVDELATALGVLGTVVQKDRYGDRSVRITLPDPKIFAGRPVLLVDDIASSGSTLIACAEEVMAAGATAVDAIVVHALFPPEALAEFQKAGIRSVRSTTSVPHPTNAIVLDDLLAAALQPEMSPTRASEHTS